jgi:hypothetical protein
MFFEDMKSGTWLRHEGGRYTWIGHLINVSEEHMRHGDMERRRGRAHNDESNYQSWRHGSYNIFSAVMPALRNVSWRSDGQYHITPISNVETKVSHRVSWVSHRVSWGFTQSWHGGLYGASN